jgi:ribose transport system permease protein
VSPAGGSKASGRLDVAATLRRWIASPEASVVVVMLLLIVFMAINGELKPFVQPFNQQSLSRSISLQAIFAIGELLVILTGGIDLSVGSLIAFDGMLLASVMSRLADGGMPIPQATAIGIGVVLLFSLAVGLIHATLIHSLRLPPFVVTLASFSILRSGAQLLNNAVPIPIERFKLIGYLGNGSVYIAGTTVNAPVTTVILAVIAVACAAILSFSRMGRRIYSVGSNEEATRLSGVNVFQVRAFVYGASSLLAGVAAILYAGYGAQGDPSSGVMFELNAISAVVIGGGVLTGGRGSVAGTVLGALLLEWILNVINLNPHLSNPTLWRGTVVGGVLLLAVIVNQLRLMGLFARLRGIWGR